MEFKLLFALVLVLISATKTKCQHFMIIGGSLATVGEFPYIIRFASSCTGILLSLTQVLVPALEREVSDCWGPQGHQQIDFYAGTTLSWTDYEETIQITTATLVEHYCGNSNELKVLEIDPLKVTDEVRPISLAPANFQFPESGYIVGFPRITRSPNNSDSSWYHQQKLKVNINNRTYCNEYGSEVCTGTIRGGVGTCTDDWVEDRQDFVPLICKTGNGEDVLCGLLQKGCCGKPHCLDSFFDLTDQTVVSCLNGIINPN